MRYILMIFGPEETPYPGDAGYDATLAEYEAFTRDAAEAGVILGGDELDAPYTATTVRVRDGAALLTDGPYAETKEQIGGYFIVEAPNLDEALKWAARIPGAKNGAVEVRPLIDHPAPDALS
jgi:hypothetical protein